MRHNTDPSNKKLRAEYSTAVKADSIVARIRFILRRLAFSLQRMLVPELIHSHERYRRFLQERTALGSDWLDVGCGKAIISPWLRNSLDSEKELVSRCNRVAGVDCGDDLPHRSIKERYCARAESIPFVNDSFSQVTANMVVEHFTDPETALREICRVLRPEGLFMFHTPNARSPLIALSRIIPSRVRSAIAAFLDGRNEEDIFPTYYRLNDTGRIKLIAERSGFSVSSVEFVENYPVLAMLGPVVVIELFAIRLLRLQKFAYLRPNLLVVLQKSELNTRGC